MTLYFLHVPRTGGTALRLALTEAFGADKVLSVYTADGPETTPAARAFYSQTSAGHGTWSFERLSDYIAANDIAVFTSHISAVRLKCFDPAQSFMIFRHPVDRLVSTYRFLRQRNALSGTFEEFVSHSGQQNMHSKCLSGLTPEDVGVVGSFDAYDDFVQRLNARFGLSLSVRRENRTPLVSRRFLPYCSARMRDRILETNTIDLALFEQVKVMVSGRRIFG